MAKTKKQSEPISAQEIIANEPQVSEVLDVKQQGHIEEVKSFVAKIEGDAVSDEEKFLKRLLYILDSGGWTKALHPHIEERLAELKK